MTGSSPGLALAGECPVSWPGWDQLGLILSWLWPEPPEQPSQSVYTDLGSLGQRPEAVCSGAQSQKLLLRTQLCR